MTERAPRWAFMHWSTHYDPEGGWSVRVADDQGDVSPLIFTWPGDPAPPSLLQRYDALAALGYAVVEGGTEAWEWKEYTGDQGGTYFLGSTAVRPLSAAELAAQQ